MEKRSTMGKGPNHYGADNYSLAGSERAGEAVDYSAPIKL